MNFKNFQLVSTLQFTNREDIEYIFSITDKVIEKFKTKKQFDLLTDKIIATLFYEPSTRTRLSFQTACHRLGAKIISAEGIENSSLKKGETLEDTITIVEKYADMIIMRHPDSDSPQRAIKSTKKPFINAGNGSFEHPTQALFDLYTLKKAKGSLDGLKIAMVGDLKYSRVIHSQLPLWKHFDVSFVLISPKELELPQKYLDYLKENNLHYEISEDFMNSVTNVDMIYMTRVQQERFVDKNEYERLKNTYILTQKILDNTKNDVLIEHPLPRINEIPTEIDSYSGAAYFKQAEYGLFLRIALIAIAFGVEDQF